jgi:hypothetical protein
VNENINKPFQGHCGPATPTRHDFNMRSPFADIEVCWWVRLLGRRKPVVTIAVVCVLRCGVHRPVRTPSPSPRIEIERAGCLAIADGYLRDCRTPPPSAVVRGWGVWLVTRLVPRRRWLGPFWRRLGLGQSCLRVCRAPAIRRSPRPGTRRGRGTGHKRPNRACWIGRGWGRRSPTVETCIRLRVAMMAGIRPEHGEDPGPPQDCRPRRSTAEDCRAESRRSRIRWVQMVQQIHAFPRVCEATVFDLHHLHPPILRFGGSQ